MRPDSPAAQNPLFPQQPVPISLPKLIFGPIKMKIGTVHAFIRAAENISAIEQGTSNISPRTSVPVYVLPTSERLIIVKNKSTKRPSDVDGVLYRNPRGALSWVSHRLTDDLKNEVAQSGWRTVVERIAKSWDGSLAFKEERRGPTGIVEEGGMGLRPPQIGALHAIGAHWSIQRSPATIVMPTGTGKTETMLASLAAYIRGPLVVAVPSDILRSQTARKFENFGLLRKMGVLSADASNPIVGIVTKRAKSIADLKLFECSNVVVGTMSSLAGSGATSFATDIAKMTDTLIVDEAHHIPAAQWKKLRSAFVADKRVLQFTATPYRRDAQLVEGDVIFNYPLKMAQEQGYFKPITFSPVHELVEADADKAIAVAAVSKLREDIKSGLNHIMMARCVSIKRAEAVLAIYKKIAPELNPILVHSDLTDTDRRITDLRSGTNRIAVCVNMLGEGFDLPELKIAGIHDLHKSLAILLQFTGRFTRSAAANIGDATVVANVADSNVSSALERLYSEDADWNEVLSELSSDAARDHAELIKFLKSTKRLDDGGGPSTITISQQLLRPTLSTLVYRAQQFRPNLFHNGLPDHMKPHAVWHHAPSNTLFFVTRTEPPVKWTRAKDVRDREWALFVLHHDAAKQLLFLSSTDHSSPFQGLAKATGADSLIEGEVIFRSMGGISRLIFQNVGLKKPGRRNLGYAMYTGADVAEALSIAERGASVKNNFSGTGWENGRSVAIGCSAKGRIWTREGGPIPRFVKWCDEIGVKLLDDTITTDDIIKNVLIPKAVSTIPNVDVLCVEWPNEMLRYLEEKVVISDGTREGGLFSFSLEAGPVNAARTSIEFELRHAISGEWARFALTIMSPDAYEVTQVSGAKLKVSIGRLEVFLAEYFTDYPPLVRFIDLNELDGNHLIGPQNPLTLSIADDRFDAWDWKNVDFTKESMWKDGAVRRDSIQWHVANHYSQAGFDIVFDDDASGEAADLVCIKENPTHIQLAFIHCKFAGGKTAGERVKDVVEVCSQAVRCAKWNGRFSQLCAHLRKRDQLLSGGGRSRFISGSLNDLSRIQKVSRFKEVRPEVLIAQPGLSKSGKTADQSGVLAAAMVYLKQTIDTDMDIICSA